MKYFDTPAFAHDLRIVLKSRKVAQLELSVQATVSAATVSRLFKRHSTPTPDHLACLLSWSGLSFEDYVRERPDYCRAMVARLRLSYARWNGNRTSDTIRIWSYMLFGLTILSSNRWCIGQYQGIVGEVEKPVVSPPLAFP